jgi:hypothetical protein
MPVYDPVVNVHGVFSIDHRDGVAPKRYVARGHDAWGHPAFFDGETGRELKDAFMYRLGGAEPGETTGPKVGPNGESGGGGGGGEQAGRGLHGYLNLSWVAAHFQANHTGDLPLKLMVTKIGEGLDEVLLVAKQWHHTGRADPSAGPPIAIAVDHFPLLVKLLAAAKTDEERSEVQSMMAHDSRPLRAPIIELDDEVSTQVKGGKRYVAARPERDPNIRVGSSLVTPAAVSGRGFEGGNVVAAPPVTFDISKLTGKVAPGSDRNPIIVGHHTVDVPDTRHFKHTQSNVGGAAFGPPPEPPTHMASVDGQAVPVNLRPAGSVGSAPVLLRGPNGEKEFVAEERHLTTPAAAAGITRAPAAPLKPELAPLVVVPSSSTTVHPLLQKVLTPVVYNPVTVAGYAGCPFRQKALALANALVTSGQYSAVVDKSFNTRALYQTWLQSPQGRAVFVSQPRALQYTMSPFVFLGSPDRYLGRTFIGGYDDLAAKWPKFA